MKKSFDLEKILRKILSMTIAPLAIVAPFLLLIGTIAIKAHNGAVAVLAFECGFGAALVAWVCWLIEEPA